MIIMKEEEPAIDRVSLELEWLQFSAMCKIFGFRRPPVTKGQFIAYAKARRKVQGQVLKRIETL